MNELLTCEGLTKSYQKGTNALDGIELHIAEKIRRAARLPHPFFGERVVHAPCKSAAHIALALPVAHKIHDRHICLRNRNCLYFSTKSARVRNFPLCFAKNIDDFS